VEILNFVFRLGVLFAIYGFIWGLFDLGLRLISSGRQRTVAEVYIIKAIRYFFLVNVTFLSCMKDGYGSIDMNEFVITCAVLLVYFLSRFQNSQRQSAIFKVMVNNRLSTNLTEFNAKAEIGVIVGAIAFFIAFWFYPQAAINPIAEWFVDSIKSIEKTVFLGFIFRVIGFFFLVSIFIKMFNTITFLLNGGQEQGHQMPIDQDEDMDDSEFSDYEEVD